MSQHYTGLSKAELELRLQNVRLIKEAHKLMLHKFYDDFVLEFGNDINELDPETFNKWIEGTLTSQVMVDKFFAKCKAGLV